MTSQNRRILAKADYSFKEFTPPILLILICATDPLLPNGTSYQGDQHPCFVYGRSRIEISARKDAILAKAFCDFLQSLQATVGIVT
jgi:hypothetical protein